MIVKEIFIGFEIDEYFSSKKRLNEKLRMNGKFLKLISILF